jgi:hypothetical protein
MMTEDELAGLLKELNLSIKDLPASSSPQVQ